MFCTFLYSYTRIIHAYTFTQGWFQYGSSDQMLLKLKLHRCCWRILETVHVGDNFEVTDSLNWKSHQQSHPHCSPILQLKINKKSLLESVLLSCGRLRVLWWLNIQRKIQWIVMQQYFGLYSNRVWSLGHFMFSFRGMERKKLQITTEFFSTVYSPHSQAALLLFSLFSKPLDLPTLLVPGDSTCDKAGF